RGTLVRGAIALVVERSNGSLLVVDYKTDDLRGPRRRNRGASRSMQGREPETIVSRYAVQRDLYALAAGARGGPVETAYVFLERPGTPVTAVFDEDALEQGAARIGERLR